MLGQLLESLLAVVLGIGVCTLYFVGSNFILESSLSDSGKFSLKKEQWMKRIQPWLFLAPAIFLLSVYLIFPVIETIRLVSLTLEALTLLDLKITSGHLTILISRWQL